MSKQTASNLFICPSIKQVAEFYQHLLAGITTYEELGNRSLEQIKVAHAFRQVEAVRELSRVLITVPMREYRLIGQYYLAWCEFRESNCNDRALEHVIERSETYKSKALITRATFEVYRSRPETGLQFYAEALRANPTISDYIVASRGIAHAKSLEGFHASALRDVERLIPLLRHAEPLTYYDVLNSYAVELSEVGRLHEAKQVSSLVVASPFIRHYPEWQETLRDVEIRQMSRSVATFSQTIPATGNLLRIPLAARSGSVAEPAKERSPLLDMQAWKKKMTKEDEKPPRPATSEEKQARLKELKKLKPREVIIKIMDKIGDEQVTDAQLLKALILLEELESLEDEE